MLEGKEPGLYWSGNVWWRRRVVPLAARGRKISYERGFLFDRLSIYDPRSSERAVLMIDRSSRAVAELAVSGLEEQAGAIEAGEGARGREAVLEG